jgi:hypothetical protein
MSLGISMQKAFPNKQGFVAIMMVSFAMFSPLGVAMGMAL